MKLLLRNSCQTHSLPETIAAQRKHTSLSPWFLFWRIHLKQKRQKYFKISYGSLIAILLIFLLSCHNLDEFAENYMVGLDATYHTDQGHIKFDDTGNILVTLNNIQVRYNPSFNDTSFVAAYVFQRNADIYAHCCTGSSDCQATEQKACLTGIGFSNDLGFGGDRYILQHPPRPFNKYAEAWYMDVFVADKSGIPENYQGEYNHFSSPVNVVEDRAQYDVYLGVYYSIYGADAGHSGIRPILKTFSFGDQQFYKPVAPDLLSPRIPIEARFFPQSELDPRGSDYLIPHMTEWGVYHGAPEKVDQRRVIKINEIANRIDGLTDNDYIELYNPSASNISLDGAYIQKFTDLGCDTLGGSSDRISLKGVNVPAGGYYTLARAGHSLAGINKTFSFAISESDCIVLTTDNGDVSSTTANNVIDFVGPEDSTLANQHEGAGLAPELVQNTSLGVSTKIGIVRCPNGQDTENNQADFQYQTVTIGAANNCAGSGAGQLLSTSFTPDPGFTEAVVAGQPLSNTCPAGTAARTGADGVTNASLTSSFGGRDLGYSCITSAAFTAGRPVSFSYYATASTSNGSNTIRGQAKFQWYYGGGCTGGTTTESGGGQNAPQGSYIRIGYTSIAPTTATGLRIIMDMQDSGGSGAGIDDRFCADDVTVTSR